VLESLGQPWKQSQSQKNPVVLEASGASLTIHSIESEERHSRLMKLEDSEFVLPAPNSLEEASKLYSSSISVLMAVESSSGGVGTRSRRISPCCDLYSYSVFQT